jgi:hypothetical protein
LDQRERIGIPLIDPSFTNGIMDLKKFAMSKLKGLLSADWALCHARVRKEAHPLFQDGFPNGFPRRSETHHLVVEPRLRPKAA